MGASRRERRACLTALATLLLAAPAAAQVEADPVLRGRVSVGDSALSSGSVTLHQVNEVEDGVVDSVDVGRDGSFVIRLPHVPDPERHEVFFASVRHQGILYFGPPITLPIQLDSTYLIQAYDTAVVSDPAGARLTVQVRNVFLEPDSGGWQITDLIQLRNDAARTWVTEGGVVWRYPLPAGATQMQLGQSDIVPGGTSFEGQELVVRSPIPPGERLFVVRYRVGEPFLAVPLPGGAELVELLVREPAPPLEVAGLAEVERMELEPGSTYRRFRAEGYTGEVLTLREGEDTTPPRLEWVAVLLATLLTAAGLWAVLGRQGAVSTARRAPAPAGEPDAGGAGRRAVLVEIARLDHTFEARPEPTEEERADYRRRRRELLARLDA